MTHEEARKLANAARADLLTFEKKAKALVDGGFRVFLDGTEEPRNTIPITEGSGVKLRVKRVRITEEEI